MDPQALQQIVERLQQANTILITVSRNPSLDQLAACIGMTLFINKLDKHGAAVFSGQVPSVLQFLNPEATLEQNTDSLRDFIISLDKSKADKLRYKVEGDVVKIFITPYKTSLNAEDFDYSQGDFNVEAVVALGVNSRDDLDESILAHGRILHDATVIGVSTGEVATDIGSINLHDSKASGLSEMAARICAQLDPDGLDEQIATSLLTGIVAETDRFRNQNTSPRVMQLAAQLMAAGANQQLVAEELEKTEVAPGFEELGDAESFNEPNPSNESPAAEELAVNEDGSLSIDHNGEDTDAAEQVLPEPVPHEPDNNEQFKLPSAEEANVPEEFFQEESPVEQVSTDEPNERDELLPSEEPLEEQVSRERVEQQPANSGQLTANTEPERVANEPSTDPMSFNLLPKRPPIMSRGKTISPIGSNESKQEQEIALPEPVDNYLQPEALVGEPEPVASETIEESIPQDKINQTSEAMPKAPDVVLESDLKPKLSEADTLEDIEKLIGSAHAMVTSKTTPEDDTAVRDMPTEQIAAARDAVHEEVRSEQAPLKPIESLNALPVLENINPEPTVLRPDHAEVKDPSDPPEVPPPINMSPQFFDPAGKAE